MITKKSVTSQWLPTYGLLHRIDPETCRSSLETTPLRVLELFHFSLQECPFPLLCFIIVLDSPLFYFCTCTKNWTSHFSVTKYWIVSNRLLKAPLEIIVAIYGIHQSSLLLMLIIKFPNPGRLRFTMISTQLVFLFISVASANHFASLHLRIIHVWYTRIWLFPFVILVSK